MSSLTESPAWKALKLNAEEISTTPMRQLFKEDSHRFEKFSMRFKDILLDYSKNRVTNVTMGLLHDLARQAKVTDWTDKMFSGEKINLTEGRSVLHIALRNRSNRAILVDGKDVMPDVNAVISQMKSFCYEIRSGEWTGYTGKPITDVVNIGIGGSDLGPVMVTEALKPYAHDRINVHFVSNVDGSLSRKRSKN